MHASTAENAARTHREEGCGTTQKGPDESGPFEPPWGEDSFAVTRLYGGNAQRVKQAVEGALQVNPLVRGAAFGGVEEASSLCRGGRRNGSHVGMTAPKRYQLHLWENACVDLLARPPVPCALQSLLS